MKLKFKTIISTALCIATALCCFIVPSSAETAADDISQVPMPISLDAESTYKEYLNGVAKLSTAKEDAGQIDVSAFTSNGANANYKEKYSDKADALVWEDGNGEVSFQFTSEEGLYNFFVEFLPLTTGPDFEIKLLIDGKSPFTDAETLTFTRDWKDATETPRSDEEGNEVSAEQIETGEYIYRLATDNSGVVVDPYLFALSAGEHTLTVVGNSLPVAIKDLGFIAPDEVSDYEDATKKNDYKEDSTVAPIVIQGEKATLKSDKTLISKSVGNDSAMTPLSLSVRKVNSVGGTNWSSTGQKLEWDFYVEKDGYYKFGTRFKQNEVINSDSYRWLKIDGKTPFTEAKQLEFPYATKWQTMELGTEKNPQYIWLKKGEHTVSLEVTLGDLSDNYDRLNKAVQQLGDLYLEIVMITGEIPDTNFDYELFKQIPDFEETLKDIYSQLSSLVENIEKNNDEQGSQYIAAINNMNRVLKKMEESPYIAHIYVKDYYSNYTALSSWLNEIKKMPMEIDELRFAYAGSDFGWNKANFFSNLWFEIRRLLLSYTSDYSTATESDSPKLKIWVNWGRDQTMTLQSLIRSTFTAETGIDVELQIVSNSLINGLLANNFPDLILNSARTEPVNLGMRGALYDLSQFDDLDEVLTRFQDGAETPYWHDGALYALPDTQTFFCMFYRTDILEQLGLTVPKTWDEFLTAATTIQRYHMGVYVPYTQITSVTTTDTGIGSLNLYPTLLKQYNLNLYNDELNKTNIASAPALKVFDEWTKMYTDYGYLKEADFYNRFRNGSMPLGIGSYTTYLTLESAAPEIKGRWSIANVPGVDEKNHQIAGGGTGCAIVKRSAHPKEAWEFLKWWTSAETQASYSNSVESILGPLGRISTSNVEAFKQLDWDAEDLEKLLAQWECVEEINEVPGSYYVSRAVDQAFWTVIDDKLSSKDVVTKWAKVADSEIERKIKEYK